MGENTKYEPEREKGGERMQEKNGSVMEKPGESPAAGKKKKKKERKRLPHRVWLGPAFVVAAL